MQFNEQFFQELSRSRGVTDLVTGIAEDIAADARETAPTASGDYRNGITVASKRQKRAVGLVIATDPKSLLIESRTGNLVRALNKAKRRHRG